MSHTEYIKRVEAIKSSAASIERRTQALEQLDIEYNGIDQRNVTILKEINAGSSELRVGEI
jgi:Holliday junction resolvasome RuvABC ATP-dependent DNA helicase subunit